MSEDLAKRKLLSAVSHGAIFFSSLVVTFAIPLVILLVSDDQVIKDNAKEALNFHFNVWFYGAIFGVLIWVLIGLPLLAILILVTWIAPILAIIQVLANPNKVFYYPFIFRLL